MASISGYDRTHFTIETEDLSEPEGIGAVIPLPRGRILFYLKPLCGGETPTLHVTPAEAFALGDALLRAAFEAVRV